MGPVWSLEGVMGNGLIAVVDLDVLGARAGDTFDVDAAIEAGIDVESLIKCGAAAASGEAPVGTVSDPKTDAAPGGKRAKKTDAEVGHIDVGTVTLNEKTTYTINQPEVTDGD